MLKTCTQCKTKFEGRNTKLSFCSDACRYFQRQKELPLKDCVGCGDKIKRIGAGVKYCTKCRDARAEANRKKAADKYAKSELKASINKKPKHSSSGRLSQKSFWSKGEPIKDSSGFF